MRRKAMGRSASSISPDDDPMYYVKVGWTQMLRRDLGNLLKRLIMWVCIAGSNAMPPLLSPLLGVYLFS